jgi:hypothetical protein
MRIASDAIRGQSRCRGIKVSSQISTRLFGYVLHPSKDSNNSKGKAITVNTVEIYKVVWCSGLDTRLKDGD